MSALPPKADIKRLWVHAALIAGIAAKAKQTQATSAAAQLWQSSIGMHIYNWSISIEGH
jgi:hypothetical protein